MKEWLTDEKCARILGWNSTRTPYVLTSIFVIFLSFSKTYYFQHNTQTSPSLLQPTVHYYPSILLCDVRPVPLQQRHYSTRKTTYRPLTRILYHVSVGRVTRVCVLELPVYSAHVAKLQAEHVATYMFDVNVSCPARNTVWRVRTQSWNRCVNKLRKTLFLKWSFLQERICFLGMCCFYV
jgi:hypothetical protein